MQPPVDYKKRLRNVILIVGATNPFPDFLCLVFCSLCSYDSKVQTRRIYSLGFYGRRGFHKRGIGTPTSYCAIRECCTHSSDAHIRQMRPPCNVTRSYTCLIYVWYDPARYTYSRSCFARWDLSACDTALGPHACRMASCVMRLSHNISQRQNMGCSQQMIEVDGHLSHAMISSRVRNTTFSWSIYFV